MKISKGSVWQFKGLDTKDTFVVARVVPGAYGTVWYRTVGTNEKLTARPRPDFLANFEPAQ